MDKDENVRLLAEMYAEGATRAQMAEVFGVHKDTITDWTKRPDVQAIVSEIRQQRANRILRKVDTAIAARLDNEETLRAMDLKELLAIRREFVPQRVEVGRAGEFDEAAELEAWAALDAGDDPEALPAPAVDAAVEELE